MFGIFATQDTQGKLGCLQTLAVAADNQSAQDAGGKHGIFLGQDGDCCCIGPQSRGFGMAERKAITVTVESEQDHAAMGVEIGQTLLDGLGREIRDEFKGQILMLGCQGGGAKSLRLTGTALVVNEDDAF